MEKQREAAGSSIQGDLEFPGPPVKNTDKPAKKIKFVPYPGDDDVEEAKPKGKAARNAPLRGN